MTSTVAGLGMFATRRLEPGDIILAEDPVLTENMGDRMSASQMAAMDSSLARQFQRLDYKTKVGTGTYAVCIGRR